jgi:EpsI family protein
MKSNRLILLLALLVGGLGSVFAVRSSGEQPAGIKLALPEYVGHWYGVDQEITQRERDVLAADTGFSRKRYTNGAGDAIFASIVLSGGDLDNSIHRPERCLPAQGFTIIQSSRLNIPVSSSASPRGVAVTRLRDVREASTTDGKTVRIYNLNYYWFVGYKHMTPSHLERTMLDIKDRVLHGYDQRWAYVTIASDVTEGLTPFGRSERETDAMIQDFIQQLFPQIMESSTPALAQR